MKRAGVIGWPVAHSLSPVLHGYWLKEHGIEGTYEKIPAAPEDFQGTIARLRAENGALKKEILSRGLPLPPGAAAEPQTPQNGVTLQLPSDADIDRAVAYAGQLWHRFVDAVERAQKQVFNKS